jgi:hypothetical protein
MSEIGGDKDYYRAAEAAFIRRRGTPFLLSPKDFALLKQWRALGVPLETVEQGIDDAFTRREERGATGKINSLGYCRDAVLAAWERRAEASVGRGAGRDESPDVGRSLGELRARLAEIAGRRSDLAEPLESARRSLERLASGPRAPGEIEESLVRLDRRLTGALYDALSDAERSEIEDRIEKQMAGVRDRMDDETARRTRKALARRVLRERLDLPRLTLL